MEVSDSFMLNNCDWDPAYLSELVQADFYDFKELWGTNVMDTDLVREVERVERYSPTVEDISLDDETLCKALDDIDSQ